jgi:hypothetical protein
MKARLFPLFNLTIGLALLLTYAVEAQKAEVTADAQSASPVISTTHTEFYSSRQNTESLGYTSDTTFTSANTTYLPIVFKDYRVCSKIPTLISPTNGSNPSTLIPLFRWDSGNYPDVLRLYYQVALDPQFTHVPFAGLYSPAKGVIEFRLPFNFEPATTYYWRSRFECGEIQGPYGPYSEVWSFTTGTGIISPGPQLYAPADGSTVPTTLVTLEWKPQNDAVEYAWHMRAAGSWGYFMNWVTETQATLQLSPNTTYEWWVSSRSDYAFSYDSEVWQFTTPNEFSFDSAQDPSHNFVVEDGNATFVIIGQDSK